MSSIEIFGLDGIGEVRPGDDLASIVVDATVAGGRPLAAGDVVVVTQKVVSKAENRLVAVDPNDPRGHDGVVAAETVRVLRRRGDLVISETTHGFVCANAGVDASNAPEGALVLLPEDPDASARALRDGLRARLGVAPAVLVTDSFGRAWRHGQCDVALGCAGLRPLEDWRGRTDAHGRELRATWIAVADQVAAAADLVRGKDERLPVVVVRGLGGHVGPEDGPGARALVRPAREDLFRSTSRRARPSRGSRRPHGGSHR